MLKLTNFTTQDLYRHLALLAVAEGGEVTDIRFVRQAIQREIDSRGLVQRVQKRSVRRAGRDTERRCPECGGPAVLVPVNTGRGDQIGGGWTHALQCQNRPAKDRPWLPKHCGHTEYVRGGAHGD